MDDATKKIMEAKEETFSMFSASGSITKLWAGQDENPIMHAIYKRLNDPKENEVLLTKTLKMRPSEPYIKMNKRQK